MKYIVVITITSIIIAGLPTAQALGNNLHEVTTQVMERVDEAVSCVESGFTYDCNRCCSKCSWWYICYGFPDHFHMAGRRPTPSSSYIAPPVFTDEDESQKGKRHPTPSSSYIAPPVFTDRNDKPAQQGSGSVASPVFTTDS
eukprot:scaffold29968_cov26-Cyclotella_meneghiniana.AAC.2